jgi:hypothetical protein
MSEERMKKILEEEREKLYYEQMNRGSPSH